ncbi:MAG: ADP-ribosylation factor-like protein [archaeon]|nr:ADP-ribosylation factor-like protein [archaeon]
MSAATATEETKQNLVKYGVGAAAVGLTLWGAAVLVSKLFSRRQLNISVIGNRSAGKTCLCRSLVTSEPFLDAQPSYGVNISTSLRIPKLELRLWDISVPSMRDWPRLCATSDAIFLVVQPQQSTASELQDIFALLSTEALRGKPLLIALIEPESGTPDDLMTTLQSVRQRANSTIIPWSAATTQGLTQIEQFILTL